MHWLNAAWALRRHAYKLHLGQLLEEYDLAQRQLEQIEHELHHILERIPYAQKMLTIRGVNATSLAGILGEAGDLSGYTHGNALLRHAGLNLAEAYSGKWRGKMVLSKRGRPPSPAFSLSHDDVHGHDQSRYSSPAPPQCRF